MSLRTFFCRRCRPVLFLLWELPCPLGELEDFLCHLPILTGMHSFRRSLLIMRLTCEGRLQLPPGWYYECRPNTEPLRLRTGVADARHSALRHEAGSYLPEFTMQGKHTLAEAAPES